MRLRLLLVVSALLAGEVCFGQIKSGTITGRVTDSSGAVVPGAKVSVIETATNVATDTITTGTGDYTVPSLHPAVYDVIVTKQGFSTFKKIGVVLGQGVTVAVDAQLAVGTAATVVEVRGGALTLQTESAVVGANVPSSVIAEIPNINKNPWYYASLLPGVSARWEVLDTTSAFSFGVGMYGRVKGSELSYAGGPALVGSITVDGVSVMGAQWNEANIFPNPDAIQEVKTFTSNYDASVGRGQGAVSIVTKSGTNQYHGVVFGRLRNEALNANTFSNDVMGVKKPPFKVGYYGGTIGGPIKKNKAFFFVSWQGMKHNVNVIDLLNVPAGNEAKGDFSKTLVNVNGVPTHVQIFDPFKATLLPSGLYEHPLITGPNGPSDLTQVAEPHMLAMFSSYPAPNRTPIDVYNNQNYISSRAQKYTSNNINSRLDWTRGKHSIYGAGGIQWGHILTPGPWGANVPYYYPPFGNVQNAAIISDHNPYVALGDTIAVGPTLVVDARIGMQYTHSINANRVYPDFNYAEVGVPASVVATFPWYGSPPMQPTSTPWTPLETSYNAHKDVHQTSWSSAANVTKVKGNWTLKWGMEYLVFLSSNPNPFAAGGQLSPDGCAGCQYTDVNGNSVAQNTTAAFRGLAAAGMMLGAGNWTISPGQTIRPAQAAKYFGLYTQNQWKVKPRLTLSLGLRWDFQPGPTERFNRMTMWDRGGLNPFGTAAGIGGQGAYIFPGVGRNSRHAWPTEYANLAPRLGLAYRMTDTLVMRAGYAISYMPSNTGWLAGPGIWSTFPWGVGVYAAQPYGTSPAGVVVGKETDPAVSPVFRGPGPDVTNAWNYGSTPYGWDIANYHNMYLHQWNLFFEKQVSGWLFSAGYLGSKGYKLQNPHQRVNGENGTLPDNLISCYHSGVDCPASDSALSGKGYIQTGVDPYTQNVTNPWNPNGTVPLQGGLLPVKIPRGTVEQPFPLFQFSEVIQSFGWSNYNALQLEVKHRTARGLTLDAHYVWSKETDFSSFDAESNQASDANTLQGLQLDLRNYKNNVKLGSNDVPHRFVANIVYELPFGKGHALNPQNRVARFLVGGWSIGAVELSQSGYPLGVSNAWTGALNQRPNVVPGAPFQVPKALQHWYDGKTTVTLPDGRSITPCNHCFLKYNVDAFAGATIPNPNAPGKYLNDTYWTGNAAIDYAAMRCPSIHNLNITLRRSFQVTERVAVDFQANATNALNYVNFQTYSMDMGGQNTTYPNSTNTKLGQGTSSSSYGTHGLTTFDPRQIEFALKIRF